MSVKADGIDEAMQALFGPGTDSTNRFDVLCSILSGKSDNIFWPVFHLGWSSCDDTWDHKDRLLQMIRERGAARPHLGHDDKVFYDRLPDLIRAYRGCSRSRVNGISWTTDRQVAAAFARGHRGIRVPDPVIAAAIIPKAAVVTVFTDRKESELIVKPDCLIELTVSAFELA